MEARVASLGPRRGTVASVQTGQTGARGNRTEGRERANTRITSGNICRWRSPFQKQHGGMIGASTGSYAYPRICGSFFLGRALFSWPTYSPPSLRAAASSIFCSFSFLRATILSKSPLALAGQNLLSSLSSSSPPAPPQLAGRRSCGKRKRFY